MAMAFCPECDTRIDLGPEPEEGQKVTCSNCGAYLQVVATSPIELDWVFEEYDDFDDYDEFEEFEDEEEW